MVLMRIASLLLIGGVLWGAGLDEATRQLSRGIFRELVEINTTDSVGGTTLAAEAMAKRLKEAAVWRARRDRPATGLAARPSLRDRIAHRRHGAPGNGHSIERQRLRPLLSRAPPSPPATASSGSSDKAAWAKSIAPTTSSSASPSHSNSSDPR